MISNLLKSLIIYFVFSTCLLAKTIDKIKIEGNNRISNQTIINFSEIKIGDEINNISLNNSLKNLYNTNFFENINFEINDKTLIIIVKEYPIIQSLQINGIKSNTLIEDIKDKINLKEKNPFNENFLEDNINLLTNYFRSIGYYFAKINTSIVNNENSTIDLILNIETGDKATIKNIRFIGDKKFKDRKLYTIITSEEDKFWKFISNKKYLNVERVNLDKRLLKNFYLEKGYYNVIINDAYSSLSNNKKDFTLTYNIEAGDIYYFNNLTLNLPSDFDREKFKPINKIFKKIKNNKYNLSIIEEIINEIEEISLLENYEFVDAKINEVINENKIDFIFDIVESEKVYVNRIDIFGNYVTSETFIRDNLIVDEGDPLNKILYNKSINKLKSTRIFENVESEIISTDDKSLKDIKLRIKEKPTGEISAGAGYGTNGTSFSFGIKENNYKGLGLKLAGNLAVSEDTIKGFLSYTDPNFLYSDRLLSTSVENTTTDKLKEFGYKSSLRAASISTRYEQFEDLYFSPNLAISDETLETTSSASSSYKKQAGSYFDLLFGYGLTYDKRNSPYQPTSGFVSSWNQKLPVISDDSSIYNSYTFTTYKELVDNMILSSSISGSAINSLTNDDVRVSKRLYVPSRKLRGFEAGKVGPKDGSDYVGGNYITTINTSSTVPFLLENLQNVDFKVFFDAANVWGVDYSSSVDDSNKIRTSTGIAMELLTPVGPLSFSFAEAITKASTDKTETFRFQLGTTF